MQSIACIEARTSIGGWGCTRGEAQLGQLTATGQWYNSFRMTTCSAINSVVKKEERRDIWCNGVCLPKKSLCTTKLAFLEMAENLPPANRMYRINHLFLFAYTYGGALPNKY